MGIARLGEAGLVFAVTHCSSPWFVGLTARLRGDRQA